MANTRVLLSPSFNFSPVLGNSTKFINKGKDLVRVFADKLKASGTTSQQKNAAIKIQRAFRQHQKNLEKANPNQYGFKKMAYVGKNKEFAGREYFFDQDLRVLYKGARQLRHEAGAEKVMQYGGIDEKFIGLVPRKYDFKDEAKKDNKDILQLKLKTVVLNTVVEDKLMLARNAGKPLIHKDRKVEVVDTSAFHYAARDLAILHKNGIYLRDIKSANMAFNKQSNQVNFIDVDGRIQRTPNKLYRGGSLYTPIATTRGLIDGAYYAYDEKKQSSYFRTADEYAFLLTLIASTTTEKSLQNALLYPDVDICRGIYPGALNRRNAFLFKAWLDKNVQPAYRADIEQLLTNPARYAEGAPNHPSLSQMLITSAPVKPKVAAVAAPADKKVPQTPLNPLKIQREIDSLSAAAGLRTGLTKTSELARAIERQYGAKALAAAKEHLYFLNADYSLLINDMSEAKEFLVAFRAGRLKPVAPPALAKDSKQVARLARAVTPPANDDTLVQQLLAKAPRVPQAALPPKGLDKKYFDELLPADLRKGKWQVYPAIPLEEPGKQLTPDQQKNYRIEQKQYIEKNVRAFVQQKANAAVEADLEKYRKIAGALQDKNIENALKAGKNLPAENPQDKALQARLDALKGNSPLSNQQLLNLVKNGIDPQDEKIFERLAKVAYGISPPEVQAKKEKLDQKAQAIQAEINKLKAQLDGINQRQVKVNAADDKLKQYHDKIFASPKNVEPESPQAFTPIKNEKQASINRGVSPAKEIAPANKVENDRNLLDKNRPAAVYRGKVYYPGDKIKNSRNGFYVVATPKQVVIEGKKYWPGEAVELKNGRRLVVPLLNLDFLDRY